MEEGVLVGKGLLGEEREVRLGGRILRYRETGAGGAIVFVHGVMVNGFLWREVVGRLGGRYRCILPDLPLGGHSVSMPEDADVGPRGVALCSSRTSWRRWTCVM